MAAERKAGTSYIMLYHCALVLHGKPKKCIALYSLVALSTSIRGSSTRFVGSWWLVLYQPGNRFLMFFLAFSIGKQREQSSDRNWSQVDTTPMNWSVPETSRDMVKTCGNHGEVVQTSCRCGAPSARVAVRSRLTWCSDQRRPSDFYQFDFFVHVLSYVCMTWPI